MHDAHVPTVAAPACESTPLQPDTMLTLSLGLLHDLSCFHVIPIKDVRIPKFWVCGFWSRIRVRPRPQQQRNIGSAGSPRPHWIRL